jgi:nucleoside triphosphatase YtkD
MYQTDDKPLAFVVVMARSDDKWLFVRHRERDTWEFPGGHIESGEDALTAAKREFYEETGATEFSLDFISYYGVECEDGALYGALYFADVTALGDMPEFEIAERRLFEKLPENLTYAEIYPRLYERAQQWLNLQSGKDELWDVLDENREPTGRVHRRGDPLPDGDFHVVVHVWTRNSNGEFLITKRSANKGFPLMWECTGGSAIAGDTSLAAAIREVKEETGLDVPPDSGELFRTYFRQEPGFGGGSGDFCDVWVFRCDSPIEAVVLQEGETCDAKWASPEEITQMVESGEFIPFHYLDELFRRLET